MAIPNKGGRHQLTSLQSYRSELVHMMDQLTDEMRDSVTPRDLSPQPQQSQDQHVTTMAMGYPSCPLPAISDVAPSHPTTYGSTSSFPALATAQEVPLAQISITEGNLLPLDAPTQGNSFCIRPDNSVNWILQEGGNDISSKLLLNCVAESCQYCVKVQYAVFVIYLIVSRTARLRVCKL